MSTSSRRTLTVPKMPTSESWTETLTTPRSYSSWAGCTTNRATVLPARRRRLSFWRSLLLQVGRPMPQPFVHRRNVLTFCKDNSDAQSWYLLGRCYMSQQKYPKAYEAYQQAVYRDGRNPTFWCSIGVLYYQINQYRDALDAYSRAIRLNPFISEVWYDLGTLVSQVATSPTTCVLQTIDIRASMRAATTRLMMHWMPIRERPSWIRPTPTSRPACSFSATARLTAPVRLPCQLMSIPRHTSTKEPLDPQVLSGPTRDLVPSKPNLRQALLLGHPATGRGFRK